MTAQPEPNSLSFPPIEDLQAYYAALPNEYGYASQCRMDVLGDVRGKRMLDVDCRRGNGVIKFSDWVGQRGFVLGVDPNPEFIDIALGFMENAWRRNGLVRNNMDYRVAYAERLIDCGVPEGAFDVVFCNSSIALDYSPALAFREMYRALRPGGMLVYDGAVAEDDRDAEVVAQARKIGNAVQSAFSRNDLAKFVTSVGFDLPEYHNISVVDADTGFNDRYTVPVVETDEWVTFLRTTALIYKPRV